MEQGVQDFAMTSRIPGLPYCDLLLISAKGMGDGKLREQNTKVMEQGLEPQTSRV